MIDSTNPRIMANAIRKLFSKISAIPVVKGNPSGSGFNTLLTKIQIGSSKYKLPAEVVANPEGEATTSLTKLGIGTGIFSVGGGSRFVKLAEYEGEGIGYAAEATITLSEDIDNFDAIMVVCKLTANEGFPSGWYPVDFVKTLSTRAYSFYAGGSPAHYCDFLYATGTTLTALRTTGAYIYSVYGIKF